VVGQLLVQVIAEVPSNAQSISGDSHQLALGADPLEERHELELEEASWIDGRSPAFLVDRRAVARIPYR